MIALDTNVLSELMRPSPAPEVRQWLLQEVADETLVTTVITVSEIEYGLSRLPDGRRKQDLEERFATLTGPRFNFMVLPLDEAAARLSGKMRGLRASKGLGSQLADMMIAAITKLAGARIATRNTKDFTDLGIELINPWNRVN